MGPKGSFSLFFFISMHSGIYSGFTVKDPRTRYDSLRPAVRSAVNKTRVRITKIRKFYWR